MIEVYTTKQAAEILGVDEATLWRWRQEGAITCRKRGRWIRYTAEDLQEFIDQTKMTEKPKNGKSKSR